MTGRWKTVIHVHTNYSHDSNRSPEELVATAERQGVDCVAVTDHDTLDGALRARALGRVRIVVGEEVTTADGHLIGLFLDETVPAGLKAEEAAERIRAQGGVVLAPHPFTTLCDDGLHEAVERLVPWLDGVEICNSQNPLPWQDWKAAAFAKRHGLRGYVGADAHLAGSLAGGFQWMEPFEGATEFRQSLATAILKPRRFGVRYIARMAFHDLRAALTSGYPTGFGVNAPDRRLSKTPQSSSSDREVVGPRG